MNSELTSKKMLTTLCLVVGHLATLVAGKVPDHSGLVFHCADGEDDTSHEYLTHPKLPSHSNPASHSELSQLCLQIVGGSLARSSGRRGVGSPSVAGKVKAGSRLRVGLARMTSDTGTKVNREK